MGLMSPRQLLAALRLCQGPFQCPRLSQASQQCLHNSSASCHISADNRDNKQASGVRPKKTMASASSWSMFVKEQYQGYKGDAMKLVQQLSQNWQSMDEAAKAPYKRAAEEANALKRQLLSKGIPEKIPKKLMASASSWSMFVKERYQGYKGDVTQLSPQLSQEWQSMDEAAKAPFKRAAEEANALKRQQLSSGVPEKVTQAPSAYALFIKQGTQGGTGKLPERIKELAKEWQAMDEQAREPFQKKAEEAKAAVAAAKAAAAAAASDMQSDERH